jgi:simple sugar transport system permease protein
VDLSGLTGTVYEIYSPGYGFTAVAVALLARLSPYGTIASALFFGALQAGSEGMERTAGVSSVVVDVLQGGILLILLGSQGIRWVNARSERP